MQSGTGQQKPSFSPRSGWSSHLEVRGPVFCPTPLTQCEFKPRGLQLPSTALVPPHDRSVIIHSSFSGTSYKAGPLGSHDRVICGARRVEHWRYVAQWGEHMHPILFLRLSLVVTALGQFHFQACKCASIRGSHMSYGCYCTYWVCIPTCRSVVYVCRAVCSGFPLGM